MKDYKLVLVIGNGFDLDLGLPTSYKDFLKSKDFTHFLDSENMKSDYGYEISNKDNLFQYLGEKYQCKNWIDIENELKELATKITKEVDNYGRVYNALPVASEGKNHSFDVLCKQLCLYLKKLDYNFVRGDSTALKLLSLINRDSHLIHSI